MNTADTKVWKEALLQLRANAERNEEVISEIEEEIKLQEERNKQEVMAAYETVKAQAESLEALLKQIDSDDLFALPADQQARESLRKSVSERLEMTNDLLSHAQALLESQTISQDKLEKLSRQEKKAGKPAAKLPPFPRKALLGNWIHYFQKDMFTCQSFWDDSEFKEYDFIDGKLAEERSGTYETDDGSVTLHFEDGHDSRYTVTGFSDDCLDYLIDDTAIRFDYMPEELLNSLLEESTH